ncbi:MAG: hypothetical protein HY763_10885 [Planctomycetes bacterium]|nr:hypothetical protein [Planctomycetota bacterium]
MLSKRGIIAALVGLNLLLLAALLSDVFALPTAYAQAGGRGGAVACLTAKAAGQSYDVLYVLDGNSKRLHAFVPASVQTRKYRPVGMRELDKDLGK